MAKHKTIATLAAIIVIASVVMFAGCVEREPITPTSSPVPSPTAKKEIPGLAYTTVYAWGYTDDADPEYDGLKVIVYFFNQKSEIISFRNTECTMAIKIYTTKYENFERVKDQLVYEGMATFNNNMEQIRIPFEAIPVEPEYGEYSSLPLNQYGTMEVTVHTPAQGDFHSDTLVMLYDQP